MKQVCLGLLVLMLALSMPGCAELAMSKMINSPEVKGALVDLLKESTKTWDSEARVNDPSVEIFYVTGVIARITGIDGKVGIRGAAPGTVVPLRPPE